ncbi:Panacea domain-containing protein [Atribacter laminatus]|uniref:Antitoxin SocA-like Panacea domain-containing protein n=1 Tax=Atribacter laminatus TaxID=2847778 RepID=A0A7T1ALP4_ATRLM|nr:type II toxin-antitoxin system antitoxin SocA domain-containing protein [Atribacter laminatus]QPM68209.1 hypothetical protein RT761_01424 [Atribacter laminatus]
MVSVFDVAAFIIDQLGPITAMKLQKLVYYCQAWSLVWDDTPLFEERIEAWSNGPVVPALFEFHKGQYIVDSIPNGDPEKLNKNQKETVEAVLVYYGKKSSRWLSDLTHMEDPWKNTRAGISNDERSNREITLESMAEYYSSLSPDF